MNRKVRVVINSIKKIFLIIKWFFVWVYRKTEQFCKRVWRRQDLLLCLATLTMIGYATFWRYDNGIFDGKEVWWMISVIAGLVVALIIGIRRLPVFFSDVHRRCILCFLWCIFSRENR